MPGEQTVELHRVVEGILDDFEAVEGGPRLSSAALSGWADIIREHPDHEKVAIQLIAVAKRFLAKAATLAAVQCVALAATVLGQARTTDSLEEAGIGAEQAKRLVRAPDAGIASPLANGLAPPRSQAKPKG